MTTRELFTTTEAAKVLGLSRQMVIRLVEQGRLTPDARIHVTRFGAFLFTPSEVERLRVLRAKKAEAKKAEAEVERLSVLRAKKTETAK